MRVRLNRGELWIYAGTEEAFENMTGDKIRRILAGQTKADEYLRHYRDHGLWVRVNSINNKRRKFTPRKEENKKSPAGSQTYRAQIKDPKF